MHMNVNEKKTSKSLHWAWWHTYNQTHRKLKQEDPKSQVNLGYTVRGFTDKQAKEKLGN